MLTNIKAKLLRLYYRWINKRAWRGATSPGTDSLLQMPGPNGQMALRMYANSNGGSQPLIVYFHGGGWVIGDLETHHPFCQALCDNSGCTVISVDYRLAPEHPYPAAHDDCLAASIWIAGRLAEFGANNGSLILAGDSAGGNLALCTALELPQQAHSLVRGILALYPVTDHYLAAFPSYTKNGKGYALSRNLMVWFWDTYVGKPASAKASANANRATPLQAENLASMPPTLLFTANNDPLRDEGIALVEKLRDHGVTVQTRNFENEQHGFACSDGETEGFKQVMAETSLWIKTLA